MWCAEGAACAGKEGVRGRARARPSRRSTSARRREGARRSGGRLADLVSARGAAPRTRPSRRDGADPRGALCARSRPRGALPPSPAASLRPTLAHSQVKTEVYKNRIRVKDFFVDYDKLRSGSITRGQFQSGLSAARMSLSPAGAQTPERAGLPRRLARARGHRALRTTRARGACVERCIPRRSASRSTCVRRPGRGCWRAPIRWRAPTAPSGAPKGRSRRPATSVSPIYCGRCWRRIRRPG